MISAAIVGMGAAARNIHMPAYAQLRGRVRVAAGCDSDSGAREKARKKWGIAVFESAREMIEQIHPEVVVVCTPPWLHQEHVTMALEHGCHVFCEKPLADSLADADRMVHAAERAGRLVVVNNQFPYMNIHLAAKQQIGGKEFGDLLYLHAWHTMRPDAVTEAGWRGEMARRVCFEFGIHVFELVRFFFDANPVRLMAHMPNPLGKAKCDVVNVITLEFADGRGASIVLDRLSRGPERYLDIRLDGERGTVHTSIGGRVRFEAGIHTRDRRPFVGFTLVKGGKAEFQNGNRTRLIAKDGINAFADATARHFANFLDAIQNGASIENGGTPRGSIRDNRDTLALVMASYDSAACGQWLSLKQYGFQEGSTARA